METATPRLRRLQRIEFDVTAGLPLPVARVTRRVVRARPGGARLDTMVASPEEPSGVLVYFPGFGTALGPWEEAKCRLLAQETGCVVVTTEILGMSRFGEPLPRSLRSELLARRPAPWAAANLEFALAALTAEGIRRTDQVHALGFSTGCTIAVEAVAGLETLGPVAELTLIEPVAIQDQRLTSLQLHNTVEWLRERAALRTNLDHVWAMRARAEQRRLPSVRYGPQDLIGIARVLASSGLASSLAGLSVPTVNLARGELSSLCPPSRFRELDSGLESRRVGGTTVTVAALGHPLWHAFPAVFGLVKLLTAGRTN